MSVIDTIREAFNHDMIRCLGIECNCIIHNDSISMMEHLRMQHPNFYALIQDFAIHGEIIDLNKFFNKDPEDPHTFISIP